jgi:uncharacterized protein (DUF1778 family)
MPPSKVINFRVSPEKQALFDRAAAVAQKTRTDFMLDALSEKAAEILADQTKFELDARRLKRFAELVDAPFGDADAVQRLLRTPAPWDK